MFVNFFIKRPIFATVCSLLIILAGAVSIPSLPIAQFPNLTPPQVTVTSNYNGASAQVVETAVTTPLEQQINGVEGMKYLTCKGFHQYLSDFVKLVVGQIQLFQPLPEVATDDRRILFQILLFDHFDDCQRGRA